MSTSVDKTARTKRRLRKPCLSPDSSKIVEIKRLLTLSIGYAKLGRVDKVIKCQHEMARLFKTAD
jgi:hypothetical protein